MSAIVGPVQEVVSSRTLAPVDVVDVHGEREQATRFAANARAAATRRAYTRDMNAFREWCAARDRDALPADPETVALYVSWLAERGYKVAYIERNVASISVAHKLSGHTPSPTSHLGVRETLKGIRNALGVAQKKKAALPLADLRRVCESLDETRSADLRDRALLLVGFAAALRRSEIVALDVSDLSFVTNGLTVTLRRSKTDQEGRGAEIDIPYGSRPQTCAVRAMRAWLDVAGATEGPAFRAVDRTQRVLARRLCDRTVARIVQKRAAAVGLADLDLAGHSLRAGFCTSAADAGVPLEQSMIQSRHKSMTIARGYIRWTSEQRWKHNAAAALDL